MAVAASGPLMAAPSTMRATKLATMSGSGAIVHRKITIITTAGDKGEYLCYPQKNKIAARPSMPMINSVYMDDLEAQMSGW